MQLIWPWRSEFMHRKEVPLAVSITGLVCQDATPSSFQLGCPPLLWMSRLPCFPTGAPMGGGSQGDGLNHATEAPALFYMRQQI